MKKFIGIYGNKIIGAVLLLLTALNISIWSAVFAKAGEPEIAVYFFNVGQGDSQFISAKDGTQILIDGGPDSSVISRLGGVMPYFDNSIDAVILTHPHADHVTGLIDVLLRYNVGVVIESGVEYNTAEYAVFQKIIKEKNIKLIIIDRPLLMSFGTAQLKFIYPHRSYAGRTLKNVHDSMIVGELVFEGRKILFMGDAEKNIERVLTDENLAGDVDVLKAGHHGSKTSSNSFFLEAVLPEYAVISAGAGNRYGHPAQATLTNLVNSGAQIFRTDLDGTVKLQINGGRLLFSSEK